MTTIDEARKRLAEFVWRNDGHLEIARKPLTRVATETLRMLAADIPALLAHTADYDALKGRLEDFATWLRREGGRFDMQEDDIEALLAALTRPDEPTKET